ncbi:MAG: LysM peptidoglycan-binding domain-containing protein [Acidimicrobiia bacterium]|nr:LysM peptidoglycan-binding domain-containing protein [Acidimicrobiia bacterium]
MPENRRARAVAVGAVLAITIAAFSLDYTVRRGDTLGRIARDHDVSLSELIEVNGIENPNLIFPGQVLVIPGEEPEEPEAVHVVVRGDTLGRIAAAYGTTVVALVERNGIRDPNRIYVGQSVSIPGSTAQAPPSNGQPSAAPSARSGAYHVVQRGESLDDIAARHSGVTAEQIATANGILGGVIYTGTRLFLDGPGFVARGTAGTRTYVVVRGDRLGDIAARNGVSLQALIDLNDISNPNFIRAGQELSIPTGDVWRCPVDGARLFNDWGFPRGGGSRWHEGNDLFVSEGTPVYAPVSGDIEQKIGYLGGNQVNLHGDDGVLYIHSHLSAFGATGHVKAGEIIGYVGTTGSAQGTRPHVHFMMYIDDGQLVVNPYPTLIEHGCKS